MINGILTILSFVSLVTFPWVVTALLTAAAACVEPLVPLALGIVADSLYYTPTVSTVPLYTLLGAVVTSVAVVVRTRLRASSIG